ncbi:S-locus lectin kinase family protein [Quillaja saponaria]|uniref:non-specific serine/threonine protein kinase n=1 Tax=Quillaja saponaria TaxID=32244 RepID=A0AAD7PUI8_QUISA|nr:S-locus lectin kinase family protein [Quillaja saponaria]
MWSSNSSQAAKKPIAQLLDSRNFVLKDGDGNSQDYLWLSFDYPFDTLLPGMKLGWNLRNGLNRHWTSWKSSVDRSSVDYTYSMDNRGIPQLIIRKGTTKVFRSGPWYGERLIRDPGLAENPVIKPNLVYNDADVYYSYEINGNITSRFVVSPTGYVRHITWSAQHSEWNPILNVVEDQCDVYDRMVFATYRMPKYIIRGSGSGCVKWFGDLIGKREVSAFGLDLYVRVAASELVVESNVITNKRRKHMVLAVALSAVVSVMLILGLVSWFIIFKSNRIKAWEAENQVRVRRDESLDYDLELPLFEMTIIEAATDNFSVANKIGEGGFGSVYKGRLQSGEEVAIKRLEESSGQGVQEFKNEVIFISQLQHRNPFKLLGCCIKWEERMLVYEYMPNRSLDYLIFDEKKRSSLNWRKSGYMSPEYAIDGHFSIKSDVFSFGVLLLEILSGKKTKAFSSRPQPKSPWSCVEALERRKGPGVDGSTT